MEFLNGARYEKDCRDFDYTGVECCGHCHADPDEELEIYVVDGVPCLLCCKLHSFFYPSASRDFSPEEKLLRAIFGERPHEQND